MDNRIIYFGRYEGWLRWLCRGVRDSDAECLKKAAELFKLMLPDECIVVPMPAHSGRPVQMREVALLIQSMASKVRCKNVLKCEPHESHYEVKKAGGIPSFIDMCCEIFQTDGLPVFIIDNVIGSGATAASALNALPNATVVTLAKGRW